MKWLSEQPKQIETSDNNTTQDSIGYNAVEARTPNTEHRIPNTAAVLGLATLLAAIAVSQTDAQTAHTAPAKPTQAKSSRAQTGKPSVKATGNAQAKTVPPLTPAQMTARLAAIEKFVDENRQSLHIPGAALVIVKDGKVIYEKGLGLRDVERKLPVTPETLFAIGSSSKAFTAMTVLMSQDDGKLKLTDAPRKYLPYFQLRDPEADKKITISDLLCHRSGLNRTDLAWAPGVLTSEEIIQVACKAKPTAKFGEKFQYQNIMFLTAGTIVGKVQGNKEWRDVVQERIFAPLGMNATETAIQQMQAVPDYSLGYSYDEDSKTTKHLPMRDLARIAPAGAINSNARDMAKWVRFMLDGGVTPGGKRLVSASAFAELTKKHMDIAGPVSYGYGWFLRDWHGHKVAEHGGNIDGFNAEVALMPDQHLGFVLLTNVTASTLGYSTMENVWQNLVGAPGADKATQAANASANAGPKVDPASEVGTYHLSAPEIDIVVTYADGKLTAKQTGQPEVTLKKIGGRRYKPGAPAPDGTFMTFRPAKGKDGKPDPNATELFVEVPGGGKVTLQKQKSDPNAKKDEAPVTGPLAELVGTYENATPHIEMEIAQKSGKVSLVVPGQPPYPLEPKSKDEYTLAGTPSGFSITAKRDAAGKITGILLKQPQGNLDLKRQVGFTADISVDALMARVIAASGGEENLRKHKSMTVTQTVDYANQGVIGESVIYARAPYSVAADTTLTALGKKIGTTRAYYNGTQGGTVASFASPAEKAGKSLDEAKIASDFYPELNWKTLYPTVTIKRIAKVEGEDCYVVEKTPAMGSAVTDYVSAKTFLIVKRDTLLSAGLAGINLPVSEVLKDYRAIDGVMIPFTRISTIPEMGDSVTTVKDVKFDAPIDDSVFAPPSGK